jgi:hypothetical protein
MGGLSEMIVRLSYLEGFGFHESKACNQLSVEPSSHAQDFKTCTWCGGLQT